jgi:hypothetical protein
MRGYTKFTNRKLRVGPEHNGTKRPHGVGVTEHVSPRGGAYPALVQGGDGAGARKLASRRDHWRGLPGKPHGGLPAPVHARPSRPRAQRACPCGARDEISTIGANARHLLLQAPLCLCLRILPGCPRQLLYAACQQHGNATPLRVARMRARAYTDALHAADAASSAMMCRCRPSRWRLSSLPT